MNALRSRCPVVVPSSSRRVPAEGPGAEAQSASKSPMALAALAYAAACCTMLGGCTTYRTAVAPPAAVLAQHHPEQIRVRMIDNSRVSLERPRIQGDSLRGYLLGEHSPKETALPLDQVASIATPKLNAGRTMLYLLGGTGAVVGMIMMASCDTESSGLGVC